MAEVEELSSEKGEQAERVLPEQANEQASGNVQAENEGITYSLPEYAYPYNKELRQALVKEFNFTAEMTTAFEKLCQYSAAPQYNDSLIELNNFVFFLAGKEDIKAFQKQSFLTPVYNLIKMVLKDGYGIIEVLEHDEQGNPAQIRLQEKRSELEQLYLYIEDNFEKSYSQFLDRTAALLSKEEALTKLAISEAQFDALLQTVDTNQLTLKQLVELSVAKRPLTLFSGNDYVKNVLMPTNKLKQLIEVFIKFLNSYYTDDMNEDIRHHVFKRVREQKLDTQRLSRIVREGIIDDAYFLFFVQLIYNIMLSVMLKISQQNFQNKEIYNLCFISYFLSRISINERNLLVERRRSDDTVEEHYNSITLGLVSTFVEKRGRKVYVPLSISNILQLDTQVFTSEAGSKDAKLLELYSDTSLRELIRKKNYTGQPIENILVFSSGNVKYYCHRVRLITSFLSVLADERETVELAIIEDWKQDAAKIISRDAEEEFINQLETQYISAFFKNYLQLVIRVLEASPVKSSNLDYVYLIQRLFFSEKDKLFIVPNTQDLLYRAADLDKKKQVLEKFVELVINEKTAKQRQAHEIIDLSFQVVRRTAIKSSHMGVVRRFFLNISEFFSTMMLFFEGNRGYLAFLARRYYKLPTLDNKKKVSVQGAQGSAGSITAPNKHSEQSKRAVTAAAATAKKGAVDRKQEKQLFIKNVPELGDLAKLKRKLEQEHDLWNIKIGEARVTLRENLDRRIASLAERFDVNAFVPDNMELFYNKMMVSLKIDPVGDKKALKRYIFYKAASLRFDRIR